MAGRTDGLKERWNDLKSHWNTPAEGRNVPIKEMVAFSAGGVGNGFMINLMYIFLTAQMIPYIYQIDVIHGTNITVLNTVLALAIQPVFAKLFDRPRTGKKWGKFKLYFTMIGPLFSLFMVAALWSPQSTDETFRTIFAYATCVPAIILGNLWYFTFMNFPNVMTTNSQERVDMLVPVNMVWSFAPTVLNVAVGPLRNYFINQDREYIAFRILGVMFAGISMVLSLLIIRYAQERTVATKQSQSEVPLLSGVRMVLKNRPFMVRQAAMIFNVLRVYLNSQFWFIAAYKYATTYGDGLTIYSMLSLITGLGGSAAMLLMPYFTRKMSKRNLQIVGTLTIIVPLLVIFLLGGFSNMTSGSVFTIVVLAATQFFFVFNSGMVQILNPAMDGDCYDYQQYISGYRLEGIMGMVTAWTAGILGQLTTYIPTFIQRSIGFQQGEERFQSDAAFLPDNMAIIDRWFNTAAIITLIASLLYMIIYLFYSLDEKKHKQIIEELEARAEADKMDDDFIPGTAEAAETLINGESAGGLE